MNISVSGLKRKNKIRGRIIKIALVQLKAMTSKQENIDRGLKAIERASQRGAKLIIFPELSFLPFFPQNPVNPLAASLAETIPGPTTDIICGVAKKFGVVIVINLYERLGKKTYDSSPIIDGDGSIAGIVRMVHIMEGPGFHEKRYYCPGNLSLLTFPTKVGRVGVAICYDRHFPEYMRILALQKAQIVVVPQAGAKNEWPKGIFEAELRVAAFQNGYFVALANRVGQEEVLNFSGESFVVDPYGQVIAQAPSGKETIIFADCDLNLINNCPAKKHFLLDRRPDFYKKIFIRDKR
ncbi:MAG: carbon-nitrogen hydrolase family protein [Candidatus Aminicenantes bacterium]|nr:carbon-nitrogen hydrolase family protein [Candidatus Aminicenantes bacterium]